MICFSFCPPPVELLKVDNSRVTGGLLLCTGLVSSRRLIMIYVLMKREREREREREETLHTFTLRILEHRDANNKVVYLHMFVFLWRISGNVLALVKFWNWKND